MKKMLVCLMALFLIACCAIAQASPSASTDNIASAPTAGQVAGAAVVNVAISQETQTVIDDVAEAVKNENKILDYIAAHYGQDVANDCAKAFEMTFEEAREVVIAKEIVTVAKVGDLSAQVSEEQITTVVPNKADEKIAGVAAHGETGVFVDLHVVDEYHVAGEIDEAIQDYVSAGNTFTLFILGIG